MNEEIDEWINMFTLSQMPNALRIFWQDDHAASCAFSVVFVLLVLQLKWPEEGLCLLQSFVHPDQQKTHTLTTNTHETFVWEAVYNKKEFTVFVSKNL